MLQLSTNISYIDFTPVIRARGLTWEEVSKRMRAHALCPVKRLFEFYAFISRRHLGQVLKRASPVLPLYFSSATTEELIVHHGIAGEVLGLLDMKDLKSQLEPLLDQAKTTGKIISNDARPVLEQLDRTMSEFTETWSYPEDITIPPEILKEAFEFRDDPEEDDEFDDYCHSIVADLIDAIQLTVSYELEINGLKSLRM